MFPTSLIFRTCCQLLTQSWSYHQPSLYIYSSDFPVLPSSCVHLFPVFFLVFVAMVFDFALFIGFGVFACSLPGFVRHVQINLPCMAACFFSKDFGILNLHPVSFSKLQSVLPRIITACSVICRNSSKAKVVSLYLKLFSWPELWTHRVGRKWRVDFLFFLCIVI